MFIVYIYAAQTCCPRGVVALVRIYKVKSLTIHGTYVYFIVRERETMFRVYVQYTQLSVAFVRIICTMIERATYTSIYLATLVHNITIYYFRQHVATGPTTVLWVVPITIWIFDEIISEYWQARLTFLQTSTNAIVINISSIFFLTYDLKKYKIASSSHAFSKL